MYTRYKKNSDLMIPSKLSDQLIMLFKKWSEHIELVKKLWSENKIEQSYKKINLIMDGLFRLIVIMESKEWQMYIFSVINRFNKFLTTSDTQTLDTIQRSFEKLSQSFKAAALNERSS